MNLRMERESAKRQAIPRSESIPSHVTWRMFWPSILCMAMGTRQKRERQEDLWVVSSEIVGTPAHAFYDRLNEILDRHHFDRNVEHVCRRYYKGPLGRPSIAPGVYFRSLLLGYFDAFWTITTGC